MISFSCIIIAGSDAKDFLQGQFTCDMNQVGETPSFGAYCNAKGRVLANFWIAKVGEGYQICLPDCVVEVTLETLKKYGAFSKVEFFKQPRDEAIFAVETSNAYYIKNRIAFVFSATSLLFTPQMIDWEKLGGVSFKKGCYLGQEVVARTQHLGKLKRHLYSFESTGDVLHPGDKLTNHEHIIEGVVCDAVTTADGSVIGLAVGAKGADQV